jgi:hypothetical protein
VPIILALRRLRQEDCEFETSLDYIKEEKRKEGRKGERERRRREGRKTKEKILGRFNF